MFRPLFVLFRLIPPDMRAGFFWLGAMSVFVGLVEMVGVASILPLMATIIKPSGGSPGALASLYQLLGFDASGPPVHVAALVTICLFIGQAALSLLFSYLTIRYSARLALELSDKFATDCFAQPFEFFIDHPASELANRTCNEIGSAISIGLQQLFAILGRLAPICLIIGLLVVLQPAATLFLLIALVLVYALVYRFTSRKLERAGLNARASMDMAIQRANDMFAVSREILLSQDSRVFVSRLREQLDAYFKADSLARILPSLPKYALEAAGVTLLFILPIYRSWQGQDAVSDLPLLATFAYAGFRMLPMAQQLYVSLTILWFQNPAAERLTSVLKAAEQARLDRRDYHAMPDVLELRQIGHRYNDEGSPALEGIDLIIRRGETIAVVGPSGAGKSTLIDILIGLMAPQTGSIILDGVPLQTSPLAWLPRAIGYVPQGPLVIFDTLAANIAFGANATRIDPERCMAAAKIADIDEFIANQSKGLESVIGVDIASLSGGEKQRLAIARAIYRNPQLIVMDEPASALDPPTTKAILQRLTGPGRHHTLVVITHDMDNLELFDRICFIDGGRVVAQGHISQLRQSSEAFQRFEMGLTSGRN